MTAFAFNGRAPIWPHRGIGSPEFLVKRLSHAIACWQWRRVYRAQLATLPPSLIDDIGLTPGDAYAEADKPFWRA